MPSYAPKFLLEDLCSKTHKIALQSAIGRCKVHPVLSWSKRLYRPASPLKEASLDSTHFEARADLRWQSKTQTTAGNTRLTLWKKRDSNLPAREDVVVT